MNIVRRPSGAAVFEAEFVFGVDHASIGHFQVKRRTDACRRMALLFRWGCCNPGYVECPPVPPP
jgi:hypothetical protein